MKSRIAVTVLSVSVALLSVALSGCDNSQGVSSSSLPRDNSSNESTASSTSAESTTSENTPDETPSEIQPEVTNEIALKFKTPFDDTVDLSNAVAYGIDGEIPITDLTEENWQNVSCDYVYLAEPQGVSYNSIDNADIFNEAELTFEGAPETILHNYRKYKVGDTFSGLTLKSATTTFSPEWSHNGYFNGGTAFFEGEITLSGLCRLAPEDIDYTLKQDIQFVPDKESCKLPIINYELDENAQEPVRGGMDGGLCWCTEYSTPITLGNADDYAEFDFSDFPDDGSYVRVNVTIENVRARNELNLRAWISADIVDFEVIDD